MFISTRKQTSSIAQFQVHRSLRSCGGGIPEEGSESDRSLLLSSSDRSNRENAKKKTKRATCGGPIRWLVPAGGAERRPVPRRTLLQRRVNGTSKGTPKEGGGGTLVTYHRSKSSPLKLNSCSSVSLPFLSRKEGQKRVESTALSARRVHIQSVQV